MHPFWINKIEEQRRDRNTLFWIVFFLAVIFPVCLVGKLDVCLLFCISCFAAAITRLYYYYVEVSKEQEQLLLAAHQAQLSDEQNDEESDETLAQAQSGATEAA